MKSCIRNNYFTTAYAAHSVLKIWTEDDHKTKTSSPRLRQIVFINSAAAFLGIPDYAAYICESGAAIRKYSAGLALTSPKVSKCAVRGLADTLRMEALRLSGSISTYTIHCAFLFNFISSAFLEKQKTKSELIKRIEGTTGSTVELDKRFPSAEKVAQRIIADMVRGDFALCDDSIKFRLLFANMVGPSPKSEFDFRDPLLTTAVDQLIWPICRRRWDKMCKKDETRIKSELIS